MPPSTPSDTQKILHVTDFHIGAAFGGIPLTPQKFLEIAEHAKTLGDFTVGAKLPDESPLTIFARQIAQANSIVLTGDMIEFISQPESCDDAMMQKVGLEFHRMLLASAIDKEGKDKPVYEVLGNHERVKPYERALEKLEDEHPDYHVNASHFLIGDALFIHGDTDLTPYSMVGERAYEKRDNERNRHTDDHFVHRIGNHHVPGLILKVPGAHRLLERMLSPVFPGADPLLYTTRNQVALLFHNLDARLGEVFGRAKHVFLGHSHVPYTGVEYGLGDHQVSFHNPGGAFKGKFEEFRPLMITMKGDAVQNVESLLGQQKSKGAAR